MTVFLLQLHQSPGTKKHQQFKSGEFTGKILFIDCLPSLHDLPIILCFDIIYTKSPERIPNVPIPSPEFACTRAKLQARRQAGL
jgi:hypothetical protein